MSVEVKIPSSPDPPSECRIDAAECRLLVTELSVSWPRSVSGCEIPGSGSEIQWLRDSGSDQADQADQASDIGPRPTLDTGYLQTLSNHRKFSSTLKQ